jgi:hypothetical protein
MVGPSVAPTPTIQIATEQKFRKPTLWVSDPVFRIYIMRDPRSQGRFFWTRGSLRSWRPRPRWISNLPNCLERGAASQHHSCDVRDGRFRARS